MDSEKEVEVDVKNASYTEWWSEGMKRKKNTWPEEKIRNRCRQKEKKKLKLDWEMEDAKGIWREER